jgi:hypothetical protein
VIRRTSPTLALLLACTPAGDLADTDGSTGIGSTGPAGSTGGPAIDPAQEAVDEARERFPTYLDLHTEVIARTCTPNMGVCHNIKEYPDLRTPQTMLGIVDQPCNLAEAVPLNVYDGCERVGDSLELLGASNPGFVSEVGFVTHEVDAAMVETAILVHLRDPIPAAMLDPSALESIRLARATLQGTIEVGQLAGRVSYIQGERVLRIAAPATLTPDERALLETELQPGDPNQNGTFGGSADPFRLIVPGDPARSYLLQRLQGNVPGSPMPLANAPLSSAEIIALACWIEGLTDPARVAVDAPIDYDDCATAKSFGGANPDSGHSLSIDVQPILNQFCAVPGCHTDDYPAAGLVLTPGHSRASLLAESTQVPGTRRVEPGNPTNSYLISKLTGLGTFLGRTMPIGPDGEPVPLDDWRIEIIRAWIVAGAPED